jgi:hypothetical protein
MDHNHHEFLERLNIKKRELEDLREISVFNKYSFIGRKNKELKKIEHLIQKITRNEDFGICEECEEPIPIERLLIVPEADMCVNCQSEMEESYRSRNSIYSTSYGLRGKNASEWEETGDSDYSGGELIASGGDILPDSDMEETEIPKKPEIFLEGPPSRKDQTPTSGENRV